MEDTKIIELYHARDEQAIAETSQKYGAYCYRIAENALSIREDAEECVNDTWYVAWNRMPPETPRILRLFLGCITRNLSISRYRAKHARKRYSGMEIMLSELEDCIPAPNKVEAVIDQRQLSELISQWLDTLSDQECALFVRRYWYGDQVAELAAECGCRPQQLTQRMLRLRRKLKAFLEAEGVSI